MLTQKPPPLILGFIDNLMLTSRAESIALHMGYQVLWIGQAGQVTSPAQDSPALQLAEHLVGPGADLIEKITQVQPALIVFDLANPAIPWKEWLSLIKSSPATRRFPVLCFGPHVDGESFQTAMKLGADGAVARSQFVTDFSTLIEKYARRLDYGAIHEACQAPLSDSAKKGLELFNSREYFEAHEYLELAWNQDQTPGRELYRSILQIAVAYLQIEKGNYNGAIKMFLRLRQWIDPLPDECRGVNVAKLKADSGLVHDELVSLGKERLRDFDFGLFKPVEYSDVSSWT